MQYRLTSIPIREVLRYALGTKPPDPLPDAFLQQAQTAFQKVLDCAQPRYHYQINLLQPLLDSFLTGQDIRRHLSGCSDCVLLCATLGPQVDALIRRTQVCDMAQALWLDAAASAAIEEVCDGTQQQIALTLGKSLTTRFSCGYGDLPLSAQGDFLRVLDAGRRIGLTLSPSGMLIPIKSVTAVAGILPEGVVPNETALPCSICPRNNDCELRRKGVFCGKYSD